MGGNGEHKKSPLKERPLRYPGQSVDEEIKRVVEDEALLWMVMGTFLTAFAGLEWYRWLTAMSPQPLLYTLLAIGGVAYGWPRISKTRKKIRALALGRNGEKSVAEGLEALREKGCRVLHDLVGDGFNVDHVVISPHGIYTIETKTIRKPQGRDARVRFENGKISVDGHFPDRDPIAQGKAQAKWISTLLNETTGKNHTVRPVIVYPGWFVDPMPRGERREAWVLNDKAVPSFIDQEPETLTHQDVVEATYQLSRYIRTTN